MPCILPLLRSHHATSTTVDVTYIHDIERQLGLRDDGRGARGGGGCWVGGFGGGQGRCRRGFREIESYRRPDSRLAFDLDTAAGLTDEAIDHTEAKAGALADLLGREERLERSSGLLGCHPDPRILDCESDESAREAGPVQRQVPRPNGERTSHRHGIAGVYRDI